MVTFCAVIVNGRPCPWVAHVVTFAVGGPFAGRTYEPGQHVLLCLTHGGEIYDARRAPGDGWPRWLDADLDRLPLIRLPDRPHDRQPWPARPAGSRRVAR